MDSVLLLFASLARTQDADQLLDRIVQQVVEIPETEERQEVSSYVQLMAGLKYDKDQIRRVFREEMMRESTIYRLILLQLEKRLGSLSQSDRDRIAALNIEQLGKLAIALLNFSTQNDLQNWLSEL